MKHSFVALSCLGALWLAGAKAEADEARPESGPSIQVTVMGDCQVSGQILDRQGKVIRSLGPTGTVKAGNHKMEWDGLDDQGVRMPAGDYECRVILNPTIYTTAGAIGNTALPSTVNQNPTEILSVAADAEGNIYTANLWEEAAQDFRKWNRDDGRHVYDAQGRIRNGDPNALPYAIAVDDKYLYCSTSSHTAHGQQHIRRFRLADGQAAPFPAAAATAGHILIQDRPEDEIPAGTPAALEEILKLPLRGIAVSGGKLFVTDALDGRVLSFDKETGAPLGSFNVKLPHALAIDSAGQLWVGHEDGKVTVFSQDGKQSAEALKDLGHVPALAFGPNDTLYVADSSATQVLIYRADTRKKTATFLRSFGQKAKPGDYAPDRFYRLAGLAVDGRGNLTVAQGLQVVGARLTRFGPDGKVIWDQLGAEFCNTGNSSKEHPDEVISQVLHRYKVDKSTGAWEFRGCVLDGDPKYIRWMHGVMRLQKLGKYEFLFQGYGDGLQVYRREGDLYRLASMFGRGNPFPDGMYHDAMKEGQRRPKGDIWSWSDANGNGKVDDDEIAWVSDPRAVSAFHNAGINIDRYGNALLCNDAVTEVPMTGFDARGNPAYDLSKSRVIVPRDTSENPIFSNPVMAVRSDDGTIYVHCRSKRYPQPPEADGGWMAGWVLARFDQTGKMLWHRRLPEACPGMDAVPGGGVMLVGITWGNQGSNIYHYSDDGALIGITQPSPAFRGNGGTPDNTASLGIRRNPTDGILDMFVEDCVGNRFLWHRVDDRRKPTIHTVWLHLAEAGATLTE